MYLREHAFLSSDFHSGSSSREAIDGFSAIAAALDHGIGETAGNAGGISDLLAIMLGWSVLVAVIIYPALQLAAIATCIVFFCMRSFLRIAFGQAARLAECKPEMSLRHPKSVLQA